MHSAIMYCVINLSFCHLSESRIFADYWIALIVIILKMKSE